MKRGFLNKPRKPKSSQPSHTEDSKSDAPASVKDNSESQPNTPDSEPSTPEPSTPEPSTPEFRNEPPFNPHRPPEWVLKSRSRKEGETRFIFRQWPRDPKGEVAMMDPKIPLGKMAPNGIIYWGATLYDFYWYRPMPDVASYMSNSTGSRLAAKMRELGEVEVAAPEITWADREEDPRQLVLPEETGRDIEPWENGLSCLRGECQSVRAEEHTHAIEVALPEPPDDEHYDITSIQPENYPGPWPIVPFSFLKPGQFRSGQPKLETIIPYTLLPQKLIVHDPWNLLSMPEEIEANADWNQMPDIVHTYELQPLTAAGQRKSEHQDEIYRERVNDDSRLIIPDDTDDGTQPMPMLRIKVPPYPHKKVTPAAHLYISPGSKAGTGNHSEVYHAEWELPREMLVPRFFCQECVNDELTAMHESGELEQIIVDAVGDQPYGFVTEKVEVQPACVVDVSQRTEAGREADESIEQEIHIIEPRKVERTRAYKGPIVEIHTKVKWQTPGRDETCGHRKQGPMFCPRDDRQRSRPPTTSLRVCAKLSHAGDGHLAREAKVYQAFPSHLSEHWSGYNLVRPSREPVPVGAVVPQFYGYYAPAVREPDAPYLSPVMLLENCGIPLDTSILTPDQSKECWSLMYRLHHADWVHGSVAERNIMMQAGPLTTPQGWLRGYSPKTADGIDFRVIDFGRSCYCGEKAKEGEEDVYQELRVRGNADESIRSERAVIDKLLPPF